MKNKKIVIETIKTKQIATIPLHPQVEKILQVRNGEFPRTISEQKFNLYIKEICKEAGFTELIESTLLNPETKRKEPGTYEKWELVTSHICRRSFVTNLYGKLPNKVIMSITTHKSEKQMTDYDKTTNEENAEILGDYWNRENNN